MVRRNSIEASTRSSMADSSDDESIHGSELRVDPIAAKVKMLDGRFKRLTRDQTDSLQKVDSMEARLDTKIDSLAETMNAMQRTLSQLSNQLGIRPIEAETSRQTYPVTFSDAYVRDDHNRLPLDNRKSLLRKIELPKFEGSDAYDWLSKVERIFRVGRYSDSDKLDLVALSLEGDVLKWFNWQLIRREFRSWEDFRRRLFRKFGAAPAESPGNRLFAIKQTGIVSASVTELEELSAQVIEQQTVYKEDSITQLQVPVSKLEHSLQIHIESPNVCEHVVGCAELGTDTDVSAYVTKSEELSSQVVGLDASHLEQIFDNGLPTEMKEVWKLKESMGLENQKKSRCLKASRFNFKRKKKRIKRWFNTLSCRESWRKHKHENLQLVSGLVGFNVGDFRCHKEYGLARLGNWSQVRVEYSLLQGELFCKNTLPRKPATSSSMLPLYVYQMGVSDIQDNAKEMVADPVSLQLILDVNKTSKTLDNQRTFTPTPVASVNSLSFEVDNFELCVGHDKDIMRLKLLLHSGCNKERLTEFDFHLGENHGLLVFPWNLLPLEFFWFIHLEDKVCLSGASNSWWGWLVFDRGKSNIISGDVITLVSSKELWMEILDGDIAKPLNSTCGKLQSCDYGLEITFLRRLRVHQQQQKRKFIKSWSFKYKGIEEAVDIAQVTLLLQLFLDDLKSHLRHKWKSKHLRAVFDLQSNLSSALVVVNKPVTECKNTDAIFPLVLERTVSHAWHRWKHKPAYLQGLLEFVFALVKSQDIDKEMGADPVTQAHKFTVEKFGRLHTTRLTVLRVLCLLGTLFWRTSFKKQKFGKNWWYKFKHGLWQRVCGKELLEVEVVVAETIVDVRFDDVDRRELLIKWQDHDASETSWLFSMAFVQSYHAFKLEDKLVFGEGSIDTIKQSYCRRKREESESSNAREVSSANRGFALTEYSISREASDANGGFAVLFR